MNEIPYIAHESDMARMERINKRLWIALILTILIATVSNGLWFYRESQFEDTVITQEVEQENDNGYNNFVGGDLINGNAESENND